MRTLKELPGIKQAAAFVRRQKARRTFEIQSKGTTLADAITKAALRQPRIKANASDIALVKHQTGDQK